METMSSSSSLSVPHEPSNYDELSMQQTLLFSDSLKELKNLRSQLYSAAEYFELSYTNDDQKQIVVDTLKDYAVRALVNTVDHLGSVTYKVNGMLDERVNEVSGAELRVSCIEQRLRTCQKYIDHEGLSQQSLAITTPKHHKRYILPVGETMRASGRTLSANQWCSLDDEDHWHQFKNAVRSTIRDPPSSSVRKGRSPSPTPQRSSRPGIGIFSFTEKQTISEKRTISPSRARFPLSRSGSLQSRSTTPISSRSTTPVSSRPTTPSSPNMRHRISSDTWKSASMRIHSERDSPKQMERIPSKSKRLLKALLSRRKSAKDEALYTFLDEY
ncbi:hypothetical protein BVC80_1819g42 [Macleaya cordata]|uniref:ABI family n=1 Tax=Macleaya cordata TaxID=56857 RepID=A0A200QW86_MACCD|nr:hypothetical protein BVC80_1819g42 [Macleaya cordata]